MYTVVVADDEEELRRAIIRRVDWESIGFLVVGEAENGAEALELVEQKEPDLLLTDIRMPFVSGIELTRQVREIRPMTQIAFLSGFDEFKYAQQAIQYNIISYMLKPISMEELTGELIAIREKLDHLFQEFNSMKQIKIEKTEFLMPLLLDGFGTNTGEAWEALLRKQAVESGVLQDLNNDFQYVVLVASIRDENGENVTTQAQVHSVDTILRKYVKYESFYWNGRIISLLIATPASFERYLHILVGEVVQSTERIMGRNCAVGVSRVTASFSECHEAYREAMNALSYAGEKTSGIFYIADEEHGEGIEEQEILEIVNEVEALIRRGAENELAQYLEEMFARITTTRLSRVRVNYLMIQLLAAVCKIMYAVSDADSAAKLQRSTFLESIAFQETPFAEIQSKVVEFCLSACRMIGSQRMKSSLVLCRKTQQIIEQNYGDSDISLVSVSNEIGVSPNYLSALIKKETGKTFIDLLTDKRISVAKELLECTTMKIREISEKCGYNDQHYFSYCFKKCSGMSPNMLRQQKREDEESRKVENTV